MEGTENKRKTFIWNTALKSALILLCSGICSKSIDFFFKAYYSRKLGAEGMGLYSLVFDLSGIFVMLCNAGLGTAIAKIVSENIETKNFAMIKKCMDTSLKIVCSMGALIIIFVSIFSGTIAENILGDNRAKACIIFVIPSVLFMGIASCIKGYFYAVRKVKIPASSELLEQAVKVITITYFLNQFYSEIIVLRCVSVFLGFTIGEFSSCLYLLIFYRLDINKYTNLRKAKILNINFSVMFKKLMAVSIPTLFSSFITSTLVMQEGVWVVSGLVKFGLEYGDALSKLGIFDGMLMPLLGFPLMITGSVFALLVPEISRANALDSRIRLKMLISKLYSVGFMIGSFVALGYIIFADFLCTTIYNNADMIYFLRIFSFLLPLMFIESISVAVLNGMGLQKEILLYNILDSAYRLAVVFFLIPVVGIYGIVAMILGSNILTTALCFFTVCFKVGFLPARLGGLKRRAGRT